VYDRIDRIAEEEGLRVEEIVLISEDGVDKD